MPDNKLTPEQIEKVQEILKRYREEADRILEEHHAKVKQILAENDERKMEELKNTINEAT